MAPCMRFLGIIGLSLVLVAAGEAADSATSSESPMVICVLRPGEPWKEAARGKFVKRVSGDRVEFSLTAGDRSYDWWHMRNPDGSHSASTPLSLAEVFVPDMHKPRPLTVPRGPIVIPRDDYLVPDRISSNGKGEIRETYGSTTVMSIIGSRCPK
jgi:hypothetical protein